ncbi:helix-turn-helix domain-containing protein [Candidatus Woesearchaeota archaeon]|nr:helix-turn-helix domain-containing protein [Candidatus Woesearchaeota archaeon]
MSDEPFILLSMKDSKNIANAISNETSQKIIAYLAEHNEATESELSEKLKVPLPTIHYNIAQLKEANLVKSKEFFWSKKGKKMRVLTLAKKYIIISPDDSKTTLDKLKGMLPITLITVLISAFIKLYQESYLTSNISQGLVQQDYAQEMLKVPAVASETIATQPNYALWFLFGGLFVILGITLFNLFRKN